VSAETEGREAAAEFRRSHHLGTQPLGDLVALIEQTTGNDVAVLDGGRDEHGLTVRDRERGAVFIAVARTPHPMRQRSTLAHEWAHVLFEDWTEEPSTGTDRRPHQEIRADAFARHLLVPVQGVQEVVETRPASLGELSRVVQLFGISPAIAAIALHEAGYIDADTKSAWRTMTTAQVAARFGWTDHYQLLQAQSNTRRAPQKLLARAIEGYIENVVSAQTLATLRGVDVDEVIRGLSAEGVIPREQAPQWASVDDLPSVTVDFSDWEDDVDEGRSE
jgi:Zn-dependent peptidase ImmA (M78 family)